MGTYVAQMPPMDISVILETLTRMGHGLLSRLPYLGVAAIVFLLFLLAARLIRRAILFAGRRTVLDETLADLLSRLAGMAVQVLGRVRFLVGVGYADSIEKARATIHRVLSRTDGVLNDPGPWVYVSELAASSVNFTVYFWTGSQQANVLRVSDRVATGIKLALDEAGIDMPYPHTVVQFMGTDEPLPVAVSMPDGVAGPDSRPGEPGLSESGGRDA